jgi:D-serine deaminase-like pyridoxal phosphate-dependent protein
LGVEISQLRTPCVLIDQPRMLQNLQRMQDAVTAGGKRLRPHTKTHKSIALAERQLELGATGICCAKLGEAEVMADAGIVDIRLPYPLNPVNADRVVALLDRARISFIVDHPDVAQAWSDAMVAAGTTVDVLVKVDVGFHRCGIDPDASGAVDFLARIAALPGLRLGGLLSHAGHGYGATSAAEAESIARTEATVMRGLAEQARACGVEIDDISVGATPTARFSIHEDGITEMRPGNYIYFDRTQVALGAADWDDCALTVLARVVTVPALGRVILDCGSKTLTNDLARGFAPVPGYGAVLTEIQGLQTPTANLLVERLSEEHANVRVQGGECHLRPGDLVRIVPNHSCVVSNLVDSAWIVSGADVLEPLRISARGRIT